MSATPQKAKPAVGQDNGLLVKSIGKDKFTTNEYTDIHAAVEAAKQETQSKQGKRLADYLLEHGEVLTGEIAQACSIGNISCAASYIRPALQKRDLDIVARMPDERIPNQFGEPSMSHLWRIVYRGG